MRFTILLGGPLKVTKRLKQQVLGTRAIAADAGMGHALPLGLEVELWVGDFDSSSEELVRTYSAVERQPFPPDKDRTDGELAAEAAIARGATSLLFVGGLGGQIDHVLGHVTLALRLARSGVRTVITSGEEEMHPLLAGTAAIALPASSRLSLVALSEITGLSIEGARWPLKEASIELGSTLTLSNIALGHVGIAIRSGYGVAIAYPADER